MTASAAPGFNCTGRSNAVPMASVSVRRASAKPLAVTVNSVLPRFQVGQTEPALDVGPRGVLHAGGQLPRFDPGVNHAAACLVSHPAGDTGVIDRLLSDCRGGHRQDQADCRPENPSPHQGQLCMRRAVTSAVANCRTRRLKGVTGYACAVPDPNAGFAATESDQLGLRWFTTVRWITVIAGAGAVFAGRDVLQAPAPVGPAIAALIVFAISNVWLTWRARRATARDAQRSPRLLMCADVALLSWLLLRAGGVLNPASVFYLVEIVVAALVFGRRWTWIVAVLAVAGYAASFLAPTDDLRSAQMMHPEIALHMRGMWLAFALTAVIIAALVTRLLSALERRDRALDVLRVRNEGAMRAASLATLAAGAAHELSTPLATIAVAARELERGLADSSNEGRHDARLIRDEAARCRDHPR